MLWSERFDPWADPDPGCHVAGVTLAPVADAARADNDLALARLREARRRLRATVAIELPCARVTADSSNAIVAFAVAAQRIHPLVAVGLPGTRAATVVLEELTARGISTTIEIWSHADLFPAAQAFIRGLERRAERSRSLAEVTATAWLPVGALHAAAVARLPRTSAIAESIGEAAAQACYLTATGIFRGTRWRRLREAGASPLRPGFRAFGEARHLAEALALPGAAVALATPPRGLATGAEVDETTVAWVLGQAAKEGVDLSVLGAALHDHELQGRAVAA